MQPSLRVFWVASVMLAFIILGGTTHAANTKQMGQLKNSTVVIEETCLYDITSLCVNERDSFDLNALSESPEVPKIQDLEFTYERVHENGMDYGVGYTTSGNGTESECSQELLGSAFSSCSNSSKGSADSPNSIFWQYIYSLSFSFLFLSISYLIYVSILTKTPMPSDKSNIPETQPETRRFRENKLLLELDVPISQGTHSTVYRGAHNRRPVAIKVSHKMGTSVDASEEPLEAKHMRVLRHPNIVALVVSGSYLPLHARSKSRRGCSQMPYDTFIAMEFCDRGSLYQLTKGTMNVDMVMTSALEIAQAMAHIHSKRIIHGCLHPKHILLQSSPTDPRGYTCKVGGLGHALRLSRGCHSVTSSRFQHVSVSAPEVLKSGTLSTASDVYAFAMVMYTMSVGQLPFRELRGSQIIRSILSGERPIIPEFVPSPLAGLIRDCWSSCVHERPSFAVITETIQMSLSGRRPIYRIPEIMEATNTRLPQGQESEEGMRPGRRYACISLQPSTKTYRSDTSAILDQIPEQEAKLTTPKSSHI